MAHATRRRGVGTDGDGAAQGATWSPLRIAWPRLRLWAMGLFGIGLAPIVTAPFFGFHDWTAFWTAGHLVGSVEIVSTERTIAWQTARGLALAVFPYPPPAALLLWPFAQLPFDVSFWVHAATMLACAVAAAILGARVYRLPVSFAVLSAVAWAPVTSAVAIGQNAPFALLLAMVAISGIARGRWLRAGSAVAALLYKPTLGLPLGGVLVLRGWWRAVAVTVAGIGIWYVAGIWAAGGSPGWPLDWARTVGDWLADDGVRNADKAVSLPGLLSHAGLPDALAYLAGGLLVLAAIPRLRRAPLPEAAAGALLIGLAASPHAWGYEATVALPFIWWMMGGGIAEPWRTRLVVAAYVVAPMWMFSRYTVFSLVAALVLGAALLWLSGRWRGGAAS